MPVVSYHGFTLSFYKWCNHHRMQLDRPTYQNLLNCIYILKANVVAFRHAAHLYVHSDWVINECFVFQLRRTYGKWMNPNDMRLIWTAHQYYAKLINVMETMMKLGFKFINVVIKTNRTNYLFYNEITEEPFKPGCCVHSFIFLFSILIYIGLLYTYIFMLFYINVIGDVFTYIQLKPI